MTLTKYPLKLTLGIVALSTVLAGSVYAAGGYHGGGHHGSRMFNHLDVNEDNALTQDELAPLVERRIARFDADNDDQVTTAEIDAYLMRRVEERRARILERLDADGDGTITRSEIDAKVAEMFARADSDDDNAVSRAEARAYRELMRAEHEGDRYGRHGRHGHHGWDDDNEAPSE